MSAHGGGKGGERQLPAARPRDAERDIALSPRDERCPRGLQDHSGGGRIVPQRRVSTRGSHEDAAEQRAAWPRHGVAEVRWLALAGESAGPARHVAWEAPHRRGLVYRCGGHRELFCHAHESKVRSQGQRLAAVGGGV
eukprot:3123075-Prymnesium_polylepis.1